MKKAICLLLSLLTVLSFCSAALAEEIPLREEVPLFITASAENISVTVPIGGLNSPSNGTVVKGSIANNSSGAIKITSATVEPETDWEIVNYESGIMPFGTKKFGALINDKDVSLGDLSSTFKTIPANSKLEYSFQGKIANRSSKTTENVGKLVFVFGWADNSSTQPVPTHQVGEIVSMGGYPWVIAGLTENNVILLACSLDKIDINDTAWYYSQDVIDIVADDSFNNYQGTLLTAEQYNAVKDIENVKAINIPWWIQGGIVDENGDVVVDTIEELYAHYRPAYIIPTANLDSIIEGS